MFNDLYIQLPKDFEERYAKYKASLGGVKIEPVENEVTKKEEVPVERVNENPKTEAGKDGLGYLIFHSQRIPIGELSSGKFKLAEMLCDNFGKAKTIDTIFNHIRNEKDKNKIDNTFDSAYGGNNRKLELIRNHMREINRAITKYIKERKLKDLKFRLTLKTDKKNHPQAVWLEKYVGGRG